MGSVVWSKGGMAVEEPIVAHSCAYDDISSALARYLNDGSFTNDIPSSPPPLNSIESSLIYE